MRKVRKGDRFGAHRVLSPTGALPQAAWKVDATFSQRYANEIVVDVDVLNLDASSFRQIAESVDHDPQRIAQTVLQTVKERGKQHNPVTGSGGMLLGTIQHVGKDLVGKTAGKAGDRVASLVSLTLTPLAVSEVLEVLVPAAQLKVKGQAVLFETAPYAVIPQDLPERLTLAVLDVCGAAPQVARFCAPGQSVLILGAGGKSGVLCAHEARRAVGAKGRVVGVESFKEAAHELRALSLCDEVLEVNAQAPTEVLSEALRANHGHEYDCAISCVNVAGAEMSAILPLKPRGLAYFFSMTTSFSAAALGAEGVGKDIELRMGNGFAEGHAEHSLNIVRNHAQIRSLFVKRYL